ncbi:hypothetical protein GW796_10605 [archaeon]|nr:hypothetical protein [archaeon]
MKKNKIKLVSATVLALTISSAANAQWATINVQDFLNRMFQSAGSNAIKGAVDLTRSSIDNMVRSQTENQADTDARARKAAAELAARNAVTPSAVKYPTVEQCIEITSQPAKTPSIASAGRSAGGGTQGGGPGGKRTLVKSNAALLNKILEQKSTLGTCSDEVAGAANCAKDSTITEKYSGGDIYPRGIKGNIEGVVSDSDTNAAFKNHTMTPTGFEVAKKYASDMSYYDKPKVAEPEQLAKNPVYAALYSSMQTKLAAANDTILDIAKQQREADVPPSGIAGQVWSSATDFKTVTGLPDKPSKPSIFDIINYGVSKDFVGNSTADLSSIQEVNKRLSVSNYIAWQAYKQQQNTNILLAHMLIQMTTPITKAQVEAEFTKTQNMR